MSSPPPSSSPASTADPTELQPLVSALVELGLGTPALMLNERRAPGTTIWLLDAQDVEAVAEPLSRIVARRVPDVDGDTNDILDGLLITVGVGGYAMKNVTAERALKAKRGGATLEAPGGQVDEVPVG